MKQTNYYQFKSLKKIVIAFAIFFVPFSSSAQNADSYKTFINNTGFAVLEAQKAVIGSNKINEDGSLANLMRLQMNAIALYNSKEYAMAAYTANLSRTEAIKLLTKLKGRANKVYTVSDDEKKLFAPVIAQASQANVDLIAKQNFSRLSSKDQDYLDTRLITKAVFIQ
jgi:hypothetical protein